MRWVTHMTCKKFCTTWQKQINKPKNSSSNEPSIFLTVQIINTLLTTTQILLQNYMISTHDASFSVPQQWEIYWQTCTTAFEVDNHYWLKKGPHLCSIEWQPHSLVSLFKVNLAMRPTLSEGKKVGWATSI